VSLYPTLFQAAGLVGEDYPPLGLTMSTEETSDTSSDSSNTFWDLVTCAAAYGAYVASVPSATDIQSEVPEVAVPFVVQEANGRQWVEACLRDAGRCYENFHMSPNTFFAFI